MSCLVSQFTVIEHLNNLDSCVLALGSLYDDQSLTLIMLKTDGFLEPGEKRQTMMSKITIIAKMSGGTAV